MKKENRELIRRVDDFCSSIVRIIVMSALGFAAVLFLVCGQWSSLALLALLVGVFLFLRER